MKQTALIIGNHINALTIVSSLQAIGFDGRVVLFKPHGSPKLAAECCTNKQIEVWAPKLNNDAKDFIHLLKSEFSEEEQKTVFLTNETFHFALRDAMLSHEVSNLICHIGRAESLEYILDRFLFYHIVAKITASLCPKTIPGDHDPTAVFGSAFVLRPRISCSSRERHEKVKIIRSHDEWEAALKTLRSHGLSETDWCYQELLSVDPTQNVSICGWYDDQKPVLYCTRKVLQHPPGSGNGDVVERIDPPPADLLQATRGILAELEYHGPFELEFLRDVEKDEWKVIELNPRFWMQHGLIEQATNHTLVRNYLGIPTISAASASPRYWVNPLYQVFRLLKGDWRGGKYLLARSKWMPMGLPQALKYAPKHFKAHWELGRQ